MQCNPLKTHRTACLLSLFSVSKQPLTDFLLKYPCVSVITLQFFTPPTHPTPTFGCSELELAAVANSSVWSLGHYVRCKNH